MRSTRAGEDKPALIVDMATLTGAARVALGPDVVPVFTEDDALAARLAAPRRRRRRSRLAACRSGGRTLAMLDSKVADINNAGSSPFAGSITAALFLSRFVPDGSRWLHADIFGWNPAAKPGKPEGGEAQAIRALYALLREGI